MSGHPNNDLSGSGELAYPSYGYNMKRNWPAYHNHPNINPLDVDPEYQPVTNCYHPNAYQSEDLDSYRQHQIHTQPTQHHQTQGTRPDTSLSHSQMDQDGPGSALEEEDLVQSLPLPQRGPPATRLSNRHAPYPLTAPPQPLTTATTTYKGGRTQRPNCTPKEIQASEAAQALKRQAKSDKAAAKLAKTRMKVAQKLARDVM
jgi:hypothetical protein